MQQHQQRPVDNRPFTPRAVAEKRVIDTSGVTVNIEKYDDRLSNLVPEKAENMRNLALTAQLYEQAAKEVGDIYVNRSRKDEPDDAPAIPTRIQVDVVDARKRDAVT